MRASLFLSAAVAAMLLAAPAAFAQSKVGAVTQAQLATEASTARSAEGTAQTAATTAQSTATSANTAATSAQSAAASAQTAVGTVTPSPQVVTPAGTTQATALAIPSNRVVANSVASGSGLLLVASIPEVRIFNRDPANAVLIYPPSGAVVEAQAANAPVSLGASGDTLCDLIASGVWRCSN